jgi:hypothetical protein
MRKLLLSGFVASVISGPAMAADMPLKAPEPICVWCGFYAGGNIGYGFGQTRATGNTFYTGNLGGGTAGTTGLWTLSDNLTGILGGVRPAISFRLRQHLGTAGLVRHAPRSPRRHAVQPRRHAVRNRRHRRRSCEGIAVI